MGIGGAGVGGIVIALVAYFLGFDPTPSSTSPSRSTRRDARSAEGRPPTRRGSSFRCSAAPRTCGADLPAVEGAVRRRLYDGAVRSACGTGQSAMGPFYCPNDEGSISTSFFRDLSARFHAPAISPRLTYRARVGHHVQKLTGTFNRVESRRRGQAGPTRPPSGWVAGRLLPGSGDTTPAR
jgi:predicted metalloprotease